ncbi:LicD family protein [Adlercreutzia sp. ZJ141]|uniref:LicD family protein n=1 Tax=Adlercreutzia sp. ZJ141 TaxID=2709406 RepID=UPI0013EA7E22|nr:LicD family protein [Adlercreutzia sp. ZJ141]
MYIEMRDESHEIQNSQLSKTELKQCLLGILGAFDKFADDNAISYSLAYGTLIGAVRHRGFIPWDDDIDVVVPRPDYDRIVSFARKDRMIGPYAFTGYSIDAFPMPFVKLIDTRVIVRDSSTDQSIVQHPWIDVFPLDGCFADKSKHARIARASARNILMITIGNFNIYGSSQTRLRALLKRVLTPAARVLHINKWAEQRLVNLAQKGPSYEEAQYIANVIWGPYGKRERFRKKLFSSTVPLEFEGRMFPGMVGWDEYLTSIYGDYMQIPSIEERRNHGIIAYIKDGD